MINSIYSKANTALLWAMRIGTVLIVITMVMSTLAPVMHHPVFADTTDGGDVTVDETPSNDIGDGGIGDDEVNGVVEVFRKLSSSFINIILTLMVLVFAVGMVRSGFSMQAAQAFGLAGKVSNEVANMVGGILVFVLGMLTLSIVRLVISQLSGVIEVNTDLSDLTVPGIN